MREITHRHHIIPKAMIQAALKEGKIDIDTARQLLAARTKLDFVQHLQIHNLYRVIARLNGCQVRELPFEMLAMAVQYYDQQAHSAAIKLMRELARAKRSKPVNIAAHEWHYLLTAEPNPLIAFLLERWQYLWNLAKPDKLHPFDKELVDKLLARAEEAKTWKKL